MNNNIIETIMLAIEIMKIFHLTDVLVPIISIYTAKKAINTYTLHKEHQPKNIKNINLPPELTTKYSDIDFKHIASKQFSDSIIDFAQTIINNFPKESLTFFYNNINELKVTTKNFTTNTEAIYNEKDNEIEIYSTNIKEIIYHELFHMASTSSIKKDELYYSGFKQYNPQKKFTIGTGLNEGYTQLLTDRYFSTRYQEDIPKDEEYYNIQNSQGLYPLEVYIAKKLETIIDKDNMENFYLTANLPGLIDELKKYSSEDKIITFISNLDFLSNYIDDIQRTPNFKPLITKTLNDVGEFLKDTYTTKINQQLNNNLISEPEAHQKLSSYLKSLSQNGFYYTNGMFYYNKGKKFYSFIPQSQPNPIQENQSIPSSSPQSPKKR